MYMISGMICIISTEIGSSFYSGEATGGQVTFLPT